jgi:hypothetical protein
MPKTATVWHRRVKPTGRIIQVGIHDRRVAFRLIAKDSPFRGGVILERLVPIHVIGRDVQKQRDVRVEAVHGFELKGRKLEHIQARPLEIHRGNQRLTDVSRDDRLTAGRFQDLADEGRGRRLAIRACDRHNVAAQVARGQFDLGDHRETLLRRLANQRNRRRHSRAENDLLRLLEQSGSLIAEDPHHVVVERIGKIRPGIAVAEDHILASLCQKVRRGHARFPRPDHQCPHRSFNVARARREKMMAMIQKRTTTFDSLQPDNSK